MSGFRKLAKLLDELGCTEISLIAKTKIRRIYLTPSRNFKVKTEPAAR